MTDPDRYTLPLRLIHWLTAVLVAVQVGCAALNATVYEFWPGVAEAAIRTHLSLGVVILAVVVVRAALRLATPTPALPADMPAWARAAALATHLGLYAVLIALPVSGYLKLAAFGAAIPVFGVVTLPPLPFNPDLGDAARLCHDVAAIVLGALLVAHIGAAVFHRRLFGSPVLNRMV